MITAVCERALEFAKSSPPIDQLLKIEQAMSYPRNSDKPCVVADKYMPELREYIDAEFKIS